MLNCKLKFKKIRHFTPKNRCAGLSSSTNIDIHRRDIYSFLWDIHSLYLWYTFLTLRYTSLIIVIYILSLAIYFLSSCYILLSIVMCITTLAIYIPYPCDVYSNAWDIHPYTLWYTFQDLRYTSMVKIWLSDGFRLFLLKKRSPPYQ